MQIANIRFGSFTVDEFYKFLSRDQKCRFRLKANVSRQREEWSLPLMMLTKAASETLISNSKM
jgi:hypothetical protein